MRQQKTTIREFLALPPEALPAARWMQADEAGNPWEHLRDYLRPYSQQAFDHCEEIVLLSADRNGWRDGVVVTLD